MYTSWSPPGIITIIEYGPHTSRYTTPRPVHHNIIIIRYCSHIDRQVTIRLALLRKISIS